MNMLKKILLPIILCFWITSSSAQNISTYSIQWNISKVFNAETGETVEGPQFILTGGSTVQWKDVQGNIKHTYSISETIGSWTNVNQSGAILYKINSGEVEGNIEISKSGDGRKIRIILVGESSTETVELTISSFQVL
jgi:hypothetical protein